LWRAQELQAFCAAEGIVIIHEKVAKFKDQITFTHAKVSHRIASPEYGDWRMAGILSICCVKPAALLSVHIVSWPCFRAV
jgi:hypothetical protein